MLITARDGDNVMSRRTHPVIDFSFFNSDAYNAILWPVKLHNKAIKDQKKRTSKKEGKID